MMLPKTKREWKDVAKREGPLLLCVVALTTAIFAHPDPPRWLVFVIGAIVGGGGWVISVGSQHAILLGRVEGMLLAMKQTSDEMQDSLEFVKDGGEMVLRVRDPNGLPTLEKRQKNLH